MKPGDFGLGEVLRLLNQRGAGGFEWYKESCLLRRIEVRMRASSVATLSGYAALLESDPEELDLLLRALSVRVTSFFRNPDTWQRLSELLTLDRIGAGGRITAWSMGCATGEEPWSLAMLLLAHSRRSGGVPPIEAIRVIASDVDAQALTAAETGRYPAQVLGAIQEALADSFGTVLGDRFEVAPALRAIVKFRREDLTAPAARPGWHDVICCRNLLIFLGPEGQRRVLDAAFRALRPGGLLVLGRTESLSALPQADMLPADITHRVYRKAS